MNFSFSLYGFIGSGTKIHFTVLFIICEPRSKKYKCQTFFLTNQHLSDKKIRLVDCRRVPCYLKEQGQNVGNWSMSRRKRGRRTGAGESVGVGAEVEAAKNERT